MRDSNAVGVHISLVAHPNVFRIMLVFTAVYIDRFLPSISLGEDVHPILKRFVGHQRIASTRERLFLCVLLCSNVFCT